MGQPGLTIVDVMKDSWTERNTRLIHYIGHKIVGINDSEVSNKQELREALRSINPGEEVIFSIEIVFYLSFFY